MDHIDSKTSYYSEVYFNAFTRLTEDIVKAANIRDLMEEVGVKEDDNNTRIIMEKTLSKYKKKLEREFLEALEEEAEGSGFYDYLQENYEFDQKEKIIAQLEEIGGGLVIPGSIQQLENQRQNLKELSEFPKLWDYNPLD